MIGDGAASSADTKLINEQLSLVDRFEATILFKPPALPVETLIRENMRKYALFFCIYLLFLFQGCSESNQSIMSKEEAVAITKHTISKKNPFYYFQNYKIFTFERPTSWFVIVEFKNEESKVNGYDLNIHKKTGDVIYDKPYCYDLVPIPKVNKERWIDQDKAVEIAKNEAIKAGISLNHYEIIAFEQTKIWRIQLRDINNSRAGAIYIIDKRNGFIIDKIYYQ